HLLAELFSFAAEHLLLPALLRGLLRILLGLVGEFLLAASERFELLHRFVDLLLACARRLLRAVALVLILFGVEFEIEEPLEITSAAGSTATAAALALIAERDLYIAECRFGAHQVLQRLVLGRERILPLPGF